MSSKAVGWAFEQDGLPLQSRMVLYVIADSCNKAGNCYPSVGLIAKCSGISERSVQRALKDLGDRGLVARTERFDERGRRTTDTLQLPLDACVLVAVRGDTQSPLEGLRGATQSPPGVTTGSPLNMCEPPKEEKQQQVAPLPENPTSEASGNRHRKPRTPPPPNPLPAEIPDELWDSFVELRREKKAPLTGRAVQTIVRNMREYAQAASTTPEAVLERCVENGWRTVYPFKGERGATSDADDWKRNVL